MRTLIRAVVLLGPLMVAANGSTALAAEAVKTLEIGDQAPDFELPGVDDRQYCLADFADGRAQCIALTYGKGRVVVLGEAGQLSAQVFGFPPERFGTNVPGCDNRQMALNIMHWLSGLID